MPILEMILAAVTLIGGAYGFRRWVLRRLRFPENEIWYELTSAPILTAKPTGLTVNLDGVSIEDPHVAILHIWSTGTGDMPTTAFDNGDPITLRLDRPMIGEVVERAVPGSTLSVIAPDDKTLTVGPGLVRKDHRYSREFVTDGIATVTAEHSLFGATLQSAADAERESKHRLTVLSGLAILGLLVPLVLIVVAVFISLFSPELKAFLGDWVLFVFILPLLCIGFLAANSSVPTRWDRAMKKRGASRIAKYNGDPFTPVERYHSS